MPFAPRRDPAIEGPAIMAALGRAPATSTEDDEAAARLRILAPRAAALAAAADDGELDRLMGTNPEEGPRRSARA